ncbi:MAG: hypothetical protein ABI742_09040 [Gemmatimonadota bacterium]
MRNIRPPAGFGLRSGLLLLVLLPAALAGQGGVSLSGKVTLVDRGDRSTGDVGQAVVWLTGSEAPAGTPTSTEMATEEKQFVPHLRIVTPGSSIAYPNHDPFNHNVFSLSAERVFDLGLYGRGQAKSVVFDREGVIRVYCNVHAQMRGLVLVLGSSLFTQPDADGSYRIDEVPPGDYVLHAWHERAPEVTQTVRIGGGAQAPVTLTLDARGFRLVQHKDKEGKSYSDRNRRY